MPLNKIDILRRIVDISFRYQTSHLSSNLTTAGILCDIYDARGPDEPVVLSNGHAGLALYAVLEAALGADAESLFQRHGTHPNRNAGDGIYVTTGSLGLGLPIALGMAIGERRQRVFCVVSDGECSEGSVWEALAVKTRYSVDNLKIYVNVNGFSAYDAVDPNLLTARLLAFDAALDVRYTHVSLPFAKGYEAHYHILSRGEQRWLLDNLESFL